MLNLVEVNYGQQTGQSMNNRSRLYRTKPFTSDEERLEHLFKLYEEMVAAE